jgi:hypothetical protein
MGGTQVGVSRREFRVEVDGLAITGCCLVRLALLMQRVLKRGGRPLLDNADPEAVMRKLMEVRYPIYALADITVESTDAHHAAMVNEVLCALAQWQPKETEQNA